MPENNWHGEFHAKTIRESRSVSESVDRFAHKYPQLERIYDGLKWMLARGYRSNNIPALRREYNGTSYSLVNFTIDDNIIRNIAVLFVSDDNYVDIKDINFKIKEEGSPDLV